MRNILAIAALGALVSVGALAAPGDNPQRRLDYYDNAGTLHEMTLHDQKKIEMFKQHARKLEPGTLLLTLDGQVFIAQDVKMPDGHMMSEILTQQ